MERIEFLKKSLALLGIASVPAALLESCSKAGSSANVNFTIDLSNSANASLKTVGGYKLDASGVVVICTGVGAYVALSTTCTHEGCTVSYNQASRQLNCPCHSGRFDINGNVVSGPPPSPLTKYTITQSGSVLTIKS